ncbi:MAG: endonuclease/exonuclease/phosphatase family protein [Tepidisphaeraceae bacterium]
MEDVPAESSSPPARPRWIVRGLSFCGAGLLILLVAGFALRDRWLWTQWLMFVPLGIAGVVAVMWDLLFRGRSFRPRFALALLGLLTVGLHLYAMVGWRTPATPTSGARTLRVVEWNTLWGVKPDVWPTIAAALRRENADIVILAESANHWQIEHDLLNAEMPHYVIWASSADARYTAYSYREVVASRWPVTIEEKRAIPTGVAMLTRIDAPQGVVRVLVVDGESNVFTLRRPRAQGVSDLLAEYARRGTPVDVVAGDFNTQARSIGFDDLRSAGYQLAEEFSGTWTGTFKWPTAPLWDIDHVIVSPAWNVTACRFITHPWCDHRGQVVEVAKSPAR